MLVVPGAGGWGWAKTAKRAKAAKAAKAAKTKTRVLEAATSA
ncbi:hypothetical protein [Sorangium cellulosum]|nr:hypothetical protein [Sorangium cellulosum]